MCIDCFCNKTSVLKSFLQLSRLSGSFPGIPNFPGYPEIFWIIRKICSLSGNVSGYPETFQIIRKISSLSGKYPAYLENIQPIQKISSLSGNFPAYPETFQAIRKLSRLSRNFPDHPENIQPIRKISRQSGKNPDYLEIFQRVRKLLSAILRVTRKNFPDAQKLSGWQCHPATQVFGPLDCTSHSKGRNCHIDKNEVLQRKKFRGEDCGNCNERKPYPLLVMFGVGSSSLFLILILCR